MEHRLYSFVNTLYMSPIQWGIQTAHCVSNLSVRYKHNTKQHAAYYEWASGSPTIIICQGINVATLISLRDTLAPLADKLELPFTSFNEDEESLGGVITSVAVLVPETLYDCTVEFERQDDGTRIPVFSAFDGSPLNLTIDEYEFLKIVKLARLA
jgi:hypothetical protein